MYFFVFTCLVLTINQQYAACSPVPQYEYIKEADVYLRLHIVPGTWQDAGLRCYLEGGILASPTTSAMATAMTSIMKTNKFNEWNSVFTGIHDKMSKGEFTSLDGVPLADMPLEWAEGQPDNADNSEDCLALAGAGTLVDVSCDSVLPYFCLKNVSAFAAAEGNMTEANASLGGNSESSKISAVHWLEEGDSANEITDMTDEDWETPAPTSIRESAYMADYDRIPKALPDSGTKSADIIVYDFVPNMFQRYRWNNINKCATKEGYKWEPRTGSCYRFHRNSKSWYRALKTCHAEGGHLAVINSETESEVLKELFQMNHVLVIEATNNDFASIGVWRMIDLDTQWLTIHGDTLEEAGFEKWEIDEPNNWDGNENCGGVSPDGLLNDLPCGSKYQFPFICEITP